MRNSRMCTQSITGYFWGDLSFSSLSLALPPYSACNPTQQLGWTGLGQGGWFSLCSPWSVPGEGEKPRVTPLILMWCQQCPDLRLLHLLSLLPCHLQVTHWKRSSKELQTLEGRSLQPTESRKLYTHRENCHIPKLFPSILSSMATPAADNRVWIHCLWAAKGHHTICVLFSGNRLPEWNIKCWMQNL